MGARRKSGTKLASDLECATGADCSQNNPRARVWFGSDIPTAQQRVAEAMGPRGRVWRGSEVPTDQQGMKVLGTPVGHDDYIRQLLEKAQAKQQVLLDPQSARRPVSVASSPPLRFSARQLSTQSCPT